MVEVLTPELNRVVVEPVHNAEPEHTHPTPEQTPFKRVRQVRTAAQKRAERKQALDKKIVAFAERVDAITEMQERMEEAIQKDPDITIGGLFLVSEAFKGRVLPQDLAVAHEAARIYDERHNAVEWARLRYPDDKELFVELFGRIPQGKVQIVKGPATLTINCFDPIDYRDAVYVDADELKKPTTMGAYKHDSLKEELRGTLIVKNNSKIRSQEEISVDVHEEQHAIYSLFKEALGRFEEAHPEVRGTEYFLAPHAGFPFEINNLPALIGKLRACEVRRPQDRKFNQDMVAARKFQLLKGYLRYKRGGAEENVKDEILAFFKEPDMTIAKIQKYIMTDKKKGGYNEFTSENLNQLKHYLATNLGLDGLQFADRAVDDVFGKEWSGIVTTSLTELQHLQWLGYTRDECIKMLMAQPLSRWPKVVKRIDQGRNIAMQDIMENFKKRASPQEAMLPAVDQYRGTEF